MECSTFDDEWQHQVPTDPVRIGNTDVLLVKSVCPCGETQTMSHIVESCPLTKLNGGLSRLHCADGDAVSWLTNYGS